jgi:hypothetical protein
MEPAYYEIGVIASIPDQEFTSSLNGVVLNMRLFFATTTELWWLEISNATGRLHCHKFACVRESGTDLAENCRAMLARERLVLLVLDQMKNLETLTLLMGALAFSLRRTGE